MEGEGRGKGGREGGIAMAFRVGVDACVWSS